MTPPQCREVGHDWLDDSGHPVSITDAVSVPTSSKCSRCPNMRFLRIDSIGVTHVWYTYNDDHADAS